MGFRSLSLLVVAAGAVACGEGTKRYVAVLSPLNTQVGGNPVGTAEFIIDGDTLAARVDAVGLDPVMHPQYIYSSNVCPGAAADVNGDGFIDAIEGSASYGKVLVPLDGDLTQQAAGAEAFPSGEGYRYVREVKVEQLLADVRTQEPNPEEPVRKLDESLPEDTVAGGLSLGTRTFVLHGVSADLPGTVASLGDAPASRTLPIACGNIVRVE